MKDKIKSLLGDFLMTKAAGIQDILSKDVAFVLFFSGLLGFLSGMIICPTWQIAVEGAQVVAGIVQYPPGNTFYIYQTKLWTLLHQIPAIFLALGVSERTLSLVLSGVVGMISCQALSLCVLLFCGDRLLAISAPFLIFLSRSFDFSPVYPVKMMCFEHTYGMFSLSFVLLVIAFIGIGQYKAGGILLGMAPAVHPALGAWLWLIVFISVLSDHCNRSELFRKLSKYFLLGCAISLISAIYHFCFTYDVPKVPREITAPYLHAFLLNWDAHRGPVDLKSVGVYLNGMMLVVGLLYLIGFKKAIRPQALFLTRVFVVCAFLGLGFSLISPYRMPMNLNILMPTRILNLIILSFCALFMGLLKNHGESIFIQLLLLFFILILGLVGAGHLSRSWMVFSLFSFPGLFVSSLCFSEGKAEASQVKEKTLGAINAITKVILILVFMVMMGRIYKGFRSMRFYLTDNRADSVFFKKVSEGSGLLLTSGHIKFIQLRARRTLLLNSESLDVLMYTPEIGPEMNRILREVYGIDLFENSYHGAAVPPHINKYVWEKRFLTGWQDIRSKFDATEVLTPADWRLQLPLVARDERYNLYRIPD